MKGPRALRLAGEIAVAGDLDDCAAGFARFRAAGLDTLVVRDDGGADLAGLLDAARSCLERSSA